MRPFPPDEASRDALRLEYLEYALLRAQRGANRWNVSLRCEAGDHARWYDSGCRNDGTGCLCRCHDNRAVPPRAVDTT